MNPAIKIIGVEPASRHHNLSGIKRISGLPDEHFPAILDRELLDDLISVSDEEAFKAGIKVARTEGAMVSPTTGAVLHVAVEMGATSKGRAVMIATDSAAKYVSDYADYLSD
jgi:cysteine synthase A